MSEVLCYKCHLQRAKYKIRLQLVCESCFVKNTEHNFRCTLKTSIFPRNGEKILICLSGGANSACLLHLMDSCNNPEKTTKMMKFIPEVLFFDDSSIYNIPESEVTEYLQTIEKTYKCLVHRVKIEEVSPEFVNTLKGDTQRVSGLLYIEIHKWIGILANRLGIKKVVTGESASRIASMVLAGICKGAGASVNVYSGETYELDGVKFSKPMKDLLDKEICIYQHLYKLPLLYRPLLGESGFEKQTIDGLVENFLHNLQSKFPSTTHTLLRTASKLVPVRLEQKCELCNGPKDSPLCDLEQFLLYDPRFCYACQHLV